jgi:hypothetical protein
MPNATPVFEEYTKTMHEAQLFEAALQVVAATELRLPKQELTSEELQERTEWFFSRGIGWIQRRLQLSPELAEEIDALRRARNELAHGYLLRFEWLRGGNTDPPDDVTVDDVMPERVRVEMDHLMEAIEGQHEDEIRATLIELRSLRTRFAACVAALTSRWFSGMGLPELSSWAEVEELLREPRTRPDS